MAAAAGAGANSPPLKVTHAFQDKADFFEKLSEIKKYPLILSYRTCWLIYYVSSSGDSKPLNHGVTHWGNKIQAHELINSLAKEMPVFMSQLLKTIKERNPNAQLTKYTLYLGLTIPVKVIREEEIEDETQGPQRPLESTTAQEKELTFETTSTSIAGRVFFEGKDFLGEGS